MCFVNHASSKPDCWKVIECSEMYENLCYVDYEEWQAISSLGLMHIHWDFEHEEQILKKFKKFLSISH
jgi:hypothetical protein